MLVPLCGLKTYCFHSDKYPERRARISAMCKMLQLRCSFFLATTTAYTHQRNVAHDLVNLVTDALCANEYPFLLLEDDATLIDKIPPTVDIPEEADLVYWGSSKDSGPPTTDNWLKVEDYNEDFYRVYNSQTGHALVFPTKNAALFFKSVLLESLITNNYHDVLLPNMSPDKLFLTPKDGPYFYQADGRNELRTKIKWLQIHAG